MNPTLHFVPSEEIYAKAKELFDIEKKRILDLYPNVAVDHIGSSAIPNALTMGDLDIQICTDKETFSKVTKTLKSMYHVNHPDIWTNEFAPFHWKDHSEMPMSIVVTVKDSLYDDFGKSRDFFKTNPVALNAYNEIKKQFEGKTYDKYRVAKNNFLGPQGISWEEREQGILKRCKNETSK